MKKPSKIRILVVDDHFVVRVGLTGSLNMEPDMVVIGEATTGQQAADLYTKHEPDVVLMDLRLPGMSGIEAVRNICGSSPDARIIMLSTYDGDEDIYQAFQAGARGYVLKTAQREELLNAIRTVHAGDLYLSPGASARLAERLKRAELSSREKEVLELIARGKSNKEIAAALFITEVTVKLHVSNILSKLGVNDRTQAVTSALQRGIVHLD